MPRLEDAIEHLRQYNRATKPPSQEDMERAEVLAFQKLQELEPERGAPKFPSLRSIPRFHEQKMPPLDASADTLRLRVLRHARTHHLERKGRDLLDEQDLHLMLDLLKDRAIPRAGDGFEIIDYEAFARIRDELVGRNAKFRHYFAPSVFLRFARGRSGVILVAPFFSFVVRKSNIRAARVKLMGYDMLGCGFLREKDMENFVFELIPTLPQLGKLSEEFYPFYVFTAVRKFFFFLDPRRTGRIRIKELLRSPILQELHVLQRSEPLEGREALANWFSMESALRVYGVYLDLDADQNGMLSRSELASFGNGMLTEVFIDRIFDEYQTYKDAETGECEMDYKTFLDFILAMENKSTRQAIQYFWKLLDIHHTGRVDGFALGYFFRAVARALEAKHGTTSPSIDDVRDEIFDIVRPRCPGNISLDDLIQCGQAATVISMMIDAAAFWRYDNRENVIPEQDDGEGDLAEYEEEEPED